MEAMKSGGSRTELWAELGICLGVAEGFSK